MSLNNSIWQPLYSYYRNILSTSICQKFQTDWEAKFESSSKYVNHDSTAIKFYNIDNMDEVSISFDMPISRTFDLKGEKKF